MALEVHLPALWDETRLCSCCTYRNAASTLHALSGCLLVLLCVYERDARDHHLLPL
jgi:hypothetical protein